MLKKFLYIILLTSATPLLAMLKVAVGTAPEKYVIEQIGGRNVQVVCIMPEGKNPHDFSVTPDMIKKVSECKIFFHSGLLFERQLAALLNPENTQVCDFSLHVTRENAPFVHGQNHDHRTFDEHIWFSYLNLYKMAVEAEKVLARVDMRNSESYFKNRVTFCNKVNQARYAAQKKLQKYARRSFLTHHAAFTYFAIEFDMRQMPFEYNGREITPKNMAFLARFAKQYRIKSIFIQSTASENVRRAIRQATGAKLVIIDPTSYNVLATLNKFTSALEASFE